MKRTADVIMQDLEIFSRLRRNCAELFPAVSVEEMPGWVLSGAEVMLYV
jgi:hypothetical protein